MAKVLLSYQCLHVKYVVTTPALRLLLLSDVEEDSIVRQEGLWVGGHQLPVVVELKPIVSIDRTTKFSS